MGSVQGEVLHSVDPGYDGIGHRLEELFPAARPGQKRLCEEDGSELALDENASLIAPIVAEQDFELSAAIKSEHSGGEQTFHITFAGSKTYGLQQGYFSG